jgi:hypothetical protein
MPHRYHLCHGQDADYIVWESLCLEGGPETFGRWIEHTRFMIPGTQLED